MCLNVPFIILDLQVSDFVPGFLILFPQEHRTFYILCFFKYISIGNGFEAIPPEKTKTLEIILEILEIRDSDIIYRKYDIKTTMSAKILRSPKRRANTIDSIFVGNYVRSSLLFESGFTGLTTTSLVSVEGYYETVLSFQGFSPMRNASAKRRIKSNQFTNNPKFQTEDVLCNPVNPENPDSKPSWKHLPKLKQRITKNIREIH